MKINPKRFAASFFSNLGMLSPLMLLLAVAAAYLAGLAVRDATGVIALKRTSSGDKIVSLAREGIDGDKALTAARRLSVLAPAVTIVVQPGNSSIVISVSESEKFGEWVHAMTVLQSTLPDVVWQADEICLSSCPSGAAARAVITGHRQRLSARL